MKNVSIKENSFINLQAFMIDELGLKSNQLIIYAIIFGFSCDGVSYFEGSIKYLGFWTRSTKPTVIKTLQELVKKKLICKVETYKNNVKFCKYKALRNVGEIAPKTLNNIKKERPTYDEIMNEFQVETVVKDALIAFIRFRIMNKNYLTNAALESLIIELDLKFDTDNLAKAQAIYNAIKYGKSEIFV